MSLTHGHHEQSPQLHLGLIPGIHYLPPMNSMNVAIGKRLTLKEHASTVAKSKGKALPKEWDWRKHARLSDVLNQSQCGSCWALSSATVLADRIAITNNTDAPKLAVTEVCSCGADMASRAFHHDIKCCKGGVPLFAGQFFEDHGIGKDSCDPYADFCSPSSRSCSDPGQCANIERKCSSGEVYRAVKGSTRLLSEGYAKVDLSIEKIKHNLYQYGPVVACYWVMGDFTSGRWPETNNIYIYDGKSPNKGGHAVTIVGWGVDDNVPGHGKVEYWIVRNSWSDRWGDNGYFKFAMSKNGLNAKVGLDHSVNGLGGVYSWLALGKSGGGNSGNSGGNNGITNGITNGKSDDKSKRKKLMWILLAVGIGVIVLALLMSLIF